MVFLLVSGVDVVEFTLVLVQMSKLFPVGIHLRPIVLKILPVGIHLMLDLGDVFLLDAVEASLG
jgi:hypothetical protein